VVKKTWPSIYGATFVRALLYRTETVHLGVGYTGIHVIHGKDGDKKHTSTFAFEDIAKWTLDARQHEFEFELMRDGQSQECVRVGAKYCARMFRPRRRRAASPSVSQYDFYISRIWFSFERSGDEVAVEQLVRDYVGYLLKGIIKQQEQKDHELRKNVVQVSSSFLCLLISFVCSYCFVCTFHIIVLFALFCRR